jgi:hypothetical protein
VIPQTRPRRHPDEIDAVALRRWPNAGERLKELDATCRLSRHENAEGLRNGHGTTTT